MGLRPDLAVLQEVAEGDLEHEGESFWVGHNENKGLGVLAFNGFRIEPHVAWDRRIEFVVPFDVTGPMDFLLMAVWAMHGRAVQRIDERPNRQQVLQALDAYAELIRSRPTVVAGDFNNAVFWDRPGKPSNHLAAVQKLDSLGLASAYHSNRAVEQGQEPEPTLFWIWREKPGYHIDYIWLPKAWLSGLKALEVGDYTTWVASRLSDHVPLVADVDA